MTTKEKALELVDRIINLVDSEMQGWLDDDVMSYLKELRNEIENL